MASPPLPTGAARREDARGSTRTCVGCQARFASGPHALTPADMHVRVVLGPAAPDGSAKVAVDLAGKAVGRGAHLHARPDCLERACRGGLARAFKRPIAASPRDLAEQIARAAEQRIRGLLLGARRAQLVAFGDEAREKLQRGTAVLALVAVDAGASGTKGRSWAPYETARSSPSARRPISGSSSAATRSPWWPSRIRESRPRSIALALQPMQ